MNSRIFETNTESKIAVPDKEADDTDIKDKSQTAVLKCSSQELDIKSEDVLEYIMGIVQKACERVNSPETGCC